MKVLFATSFSYLPQRTGGSESSTHDLCMALIKQRVDVAVIATLGMYDSVWFLNRVAAKLSHSAFIPDYRLPYPVYRGHDIKKGIPEVLEKFRPDVVVVQAGAPFEMANAFTKEKVPVIVYVRDVEFHLNREALVLNRYIGVVANSQFTARKIEALLSVSTLVLPPLVDPDKYRVHSCRDSVLHIGLNAMKGIDISFALAARRPDIPFHFVESWPVSKEQFKDYQRRASSLKNLTIHRRSIDMRKFYKHARILLVPSRCEEAWGRVVTEAQLNGIPVIASNRGGLPESVGAGGVIVVDDNNLACWEKSLADLWDNPRLCSSLGEAALLRSLQDDISCELTIRRFLEYIENHIAAIRTISAIDTPVA